MKFSKLLKTGILSVAAIITLAGCGNNGGTTTSSQPTTSVPTGTFEIVGVTEIYAGFTSQFSVTPVQTVTWKSSNTMVLTIDANGLATAVKAGSAKITATGASGHKETINVVVTNYVPVTNITVGASATTIGQNGGFHFMDAAISPENASIKGIEFSTSDAAVATVDENGMVTAHATGSAVITAKSVDKPTLTAKTTVTVEAEDWDGYSKVTTATQYYNYEDIQLSQGLDAIPCETGETLELLVCPIEFTDYPFSRLEGGFNQFKTDMDTLFNSPTGTGYWESLSSYYEKSSYGKLKIHCEIADIYNTGVKAADTHGIAKSYQFGQAALNQHITAGHKLTDYDKDGNGHIDGIYFVYSAPDYSYVSDLDNDLFWAFVYWTQSSPNVSAPTFNHYMWASYDFVYGGLSKGSKLDAHTFIHESGHLLGSNDYYNYNKVSSQKPMGGIDMMDYNIGDHNMWTKMAYGWADPIYVSDNSKVTLKSTQEGDNLIVLSTEWNGTAFDEMLVLQFDTPTGLNKQDAETPYSGRPAVYTEPGLRVLHADCRLFNGSNQYVSPQRKLVRGDYMDVAAANTDASGRNRTKELFYQLGVIQQGKKPTMLKEGASGSTADHFHAGDYFRIEDYNKFFYQDSGKMNYEFQTGNTRKSFNYQFYVESMTATECTIVIQVID